MYIHTWKVIRKIRRQACCRCLLRCRDVTLPRYNTVQTMYWGESTAECTRLLVPCCKTAVKCTHFVIGSIIPHPFRAVSMILHNIYIYIICMMRNRLSNYLPQGVNEAVSACEGEVYVVTTKQQRFASALLEHAGEELEAILKPFPPTLCWKCFRDFVGEHSCLLVNFRNNCYVLLL